MKYMKIFAVLTTLFLLVSCGKKSEIINAELSREITDNVEFSEQLTQIDTINAQKIVPHSLTNNEIAYNTII